MIRLCLAVLASVAGLTYGQQQCIDASHTEIRGKHFYNTVTGDYVPIKGIAYYPRPNSGDFDHNNIDFFNEGHSSVWQRDIEYFKMLNVNLIRLYGVDPSVDHTSFFCALKAAGMYAMIELAASCGGCAITKSAPPSCYPESLKSRGQLIINVFSNYDNVIAFSAGNEVELPYMGFEAPIMNPPCLKKFVRDMRAFVDGCVTNHNMRKVPIGIVSADIDMDLQAQYYACRTDPDDEFENIEWYGLNSYRDCQGDSNDPNQIFGFNQLLATFEEMRLPIPVVYTEYGCVNPSFPAIDGFEGQRSFFQVDRIYQQDYLAEVTGGVVFEYSTERSNSVAPYPFTQSTFGNFGVVYFTPENCDDIDIPCEVVQFPQFDSLAEAYASVGTVTPPPADDRPDIVQCPADYVEQFSVPGDFTWPSDDVNDLWCTPVNIMSCPQCGGSGEVPAPSPAATTTTNKSPTTPVSTADEDEEVEVDEEDEVEVTGVVTVGNTNTGSSTNTGSASTNGSGSTTNGSTSTNGGSSTNGSSTTNGGSKTNGDVDDEDIVVATDSAPAPTPKPSDEDIDVVVVGVEEDSEDEDVASTTTTSSAIAYKLGSVVVAATLAMVVNSV